IHADAAVRGRAETILAHTDPLKRFSGEESLRKGEQAMTGMIKLFVGGAGLAALAAAAPSAAQYSPSYSYGYSNPYSSNPYANTYNYNRSYNYGYNGYGYGGGYAMNTGVATQQ